MQFKDYNKQSPEWKFYGSEIKAFTAEVLKGKNFRFFIEESEIDSTKKKIKEGIQNNSSVSIDVLAINCPHDKKTIKVTSNLEILYNNKVTVPGEKLQYGKYWDKSSESYKVNLGFSKNQKEKINGDLKSLTSDIDDRKEFPSLPASKNKSSIKKEENSHYDELKKIMKESIDLSNKNENNIINNNNQNNKEILSDLIKNFSNDKTETEEKKSTVLKPTKSNKDLRDLVKKQFLRKEQNLESKLIKFQDEILKIQDEILKSKREKETLRFYINHLNDENSKVEKIGNEIIIRNGPFETKYSF